MPSTRKHQPSLLAAITSPASEGPISRAVLTIDELMAMALERSPRSSTIFTMNDCRPGISNALITPCIALSASTSAIVMRCESVSHASKSDCTMASVWVHTNTLRRSMRSTMTPASGASRNVGICPAKPTVPSSSGDLVSRYTSQDVAMRVIQVPISEMLCPPKKRRKLRWRRARQACEKSPAAAIDSRCDVLVLVIITLHGLML